MASFDNFCAGFYKTWSADTSVDEAINFYLERNETGGGKNASGYSMLRAPGLHVEYSSGGTRIPAVMSLNGHLFAIIGDTLYDFTYSAGAFVLTASYAIPHPANNTKAYFVADPNLTQLVFYAAGHAYVLEAGVVTEITWPGVAIAGIAFLNRYYLFLSSEGDGFFYSEPGNAKTGTPLNFRSAEASANFYVSMLVDHEQVWLFGNGGTSQVFYNDTGDANEPFKANPSAVIPRGTEALSTPTSFNGRVWWIGDDGVFYRSNGYRPEPVSPSPVINAWRKYTTRADAVTWEAQWNGHNMIRIWFPTADETWQIDTDLPPAMAWSKVLGWDGPNGAYTAHRGMSGCLAFGKFIVGDRANGKLYSLNPDVFFDDTTRVPCERIAPILTTENHLVEFPWFELDMETGVGDGSNGDPLLGTVTPEYDPAVMISYSNDWGQNFKNELQRSLGKAGEYGKRVYIARCGMARQRVFKIRITAACKVAINDVYLSNPEMLAS